MECAVIDIHGPDLSYLMRLHLCHEWRPCGHQRVTGLCSEPLLTEARGSLRLLKKKKSDTWPWPSMLALLLGNTTGQVSR